MVNQHGGKREGSGRPPVEELRKNHSIKFTDAEWEELKAKAKSVNLTTSDYIRKKSLE